MRNCQTLESTPRSRKEEPENDSYNKEKLQLELQSQIKTK